MTLCQQCFPERLWNGDKILQPILESNNTFWVGYLCCDPKPDKKQPRSSRYDLYVDEVKRMKFEGVKVLFNHNKQRSPLGQVKLTWHDHNIPNSPFAVGFLAVIDNPLIKDTPASVFLMEDTFASLSTLESDRTSVVELSITYCGARDGCTGVIIPKERVKDIVTKYGFPKSYYYKQDNTERINAHFTSRGDMESSKEEGPKYTSPEDVLRVLPQDQYAIMKKHMTIEQETLNDLLAKHEVSEKKYSELYELFGHYSDYLSSMIQTRIMLEQNNDSDLARKRRQGFEALKNMGVLDKNCSDLQASKQMIDYCRESFKDSPENAHLERFWNSFKEQFPDLHDKLPDDKSVVTVDAAFSMISQKMRDHDVSGIVGKSRSLNQRALDVARQAFDSLEHQRKGHKEHDTNCSKLSPSSDQKERNNKDMSFKDFLKNIGLNEDSSSDNDPSPPPAKRVKRRESDQDQDNNQEFLRYATEKEKELSDLKGRFKSYRKDFQKDKKRKIEEREQQVDTLMKCIPSLTKFAEYLEDHMKNEAQGPPTPEGESQKERAMEVQDNEGDGKGKGDQRSIDASALLRRDVI
jgi:hypothetical protein